MKLHYIGSFFRISFSRKRNARKEKGLTPFSRKGGKPPKRGLVQPQNSPSWVRAPTAKPSECRQDGDAELASPLGGGGICKANAGEGAVPFGRGQHSHKTHLRGYGHRRQSRLSAGKMEWEGKGCLTKGMFGGVVWKGSAQPQNSPSWVRAPTAKPSECRQDGDAELASPLGGGGICEANAGEGLWGMDTLIRECLAVSLGLLSRRSPFPCKTKQHLVPISANIPDKACEAVLPCHVISL